MRGCSAQSFRRERLTAHLNPFLHPDVIPLVLNYEVTIQYELQRSCGSARGSGDGKMYYPVGLMLHADELFVVDKSNYRIQVFHQGTGRFLRKWGRRGVGDGEFRRPMAIALSSHLDEGKEDPIWDGPEILIIDTDQVQVFCLRNSRFRRRFPIEENGPFSFAHGIGVMGDQLVVSRSEPNQVDIIKKSNGMGVRTVGTVEIGAPPGRLWVDEAAKELWLVEPRNDRILVLDVMHGEVLRQYGGSPDGQLENPQAVACHGDEVITRTIIDW